MQSSKVKMQNVNPSAQREIASPSTSLRVAMTVLRLSLREALRQAQDKLRDEAISF